MLSSLQTKGFEHMLASFAKKKKTIITDVAKQNGCAP